MGQSQDSPGGSPVDTTRGFAALKWRWPIVLVVALPIMLGGVLLSQRTSNDAQVQSVLAVVPQEGQDTSADLIRLAVPRYAVLLTSDSALAAVAEETGLAQDSLVVSVSTSTETANLTLQVSNPSPENAVVIADAVADIGLAEADEDLTVDLSVPGPATVQAAPALSPDRLMILVGLGLGVALGVGAALLVERRRPRISGVAEVEAVADAPVVGSVPRSPSIQRLGRVPVTPDVAHAVGNLRTVLTVARPGQRCPVIAVVAARRDAGTSSIAALLTGSLASSGKRVCLIDTDLTAPSIASTFLLDPAPGLADVLEDKALFAEAARPFVPEPAAVIPTERADKAGDRLARGLAPVLAKARLDRDVVVLDCAPLLGEDDAGGVAAQHADGALLVIEPTSSVATLREAVSLLAYLHTPLIGVVVNRSDGTGPWSRSSGTGATTSRDASGGDG